MTKKDQSFMCGYRAVRTGLIDHEWTPGQITARWPQHDADSFGQGMLDALVGDSWRYRGLRGEEQALMG